MRFPLGQHKISLRNSGVWAAGLLAVAAAFALTSTTRVRAQSPMQNSAAASPPYTYEVVSVKPNKTSAIHTDISTPDNGLSETNVWLMTFIRQAFGLVLEPEVDDGLISGAPAWVSSERFDITAKMDTSMADALKKLSPDDRKLARQRMMQAILVDRFMMAIHREAREMPVYSLVIAKGGSKLHEAKPADTYANGMKLAETGAAAGQGRLLSGGGRLTGQAVPTSRLARALSRELGRPVLDRTGLTGIYDMTLLWADDDNPKDPNLTTLFIAIQEQLGLKLESGKGPVEIIVVDHIERPSGN
jgi:uncharacterized protein (TIGR03435 family)